jgi:hypothetical protein
VDDYLKDLGQMDEQDVERQYGAQNYLVSGVLSKKYQAVKVGMITLMLAITFVILRLILG